MDVCLQSRGWEGSHWLFDLCRLTDLPTQKRSDPVGQDDSSESRVVREGKKTISSKGSGSRGRFQCLFRQNGRTIRWEIQGSETIKQEEHV